MIPSPITSRGDEGSLRRSNSAGRPRIHIDAASSGVRTVSRSSATAASKVVGTSAATTTCSAIIVANCGITDSMSIGSVATGGMLESSCRPEAPDRVTGPGLRGKIDTSPVSRQRCHRCLNASTAVGSPTAGPGPHLRRNWAGSRG